MKTSKQSGTGQADPTTEAPEGVQIRSFDSLNEYEAGVELQREIWGDGFDGLVPTSFMQVGQKVGGVAAGAFDSGDRLLGFVFGLTGIENGRPVHWSHMLGVRAEARNRGIGRRLKMFQRKALAPHGIELMYWTFDPFVARNAHFNLNRLGAEVREYIPNMYGDTGSELHRHGTDRFVVEWRLSTGELGAVKGAARVLPSIEGAPIVNASKGDDGLPRPRREKLEESPVVLIEIPDGPWLSSGNAVPLAGQWQQSIRRAFGWYLDRDYTVAGFHSRDEDGRSFYVLTKSSA